MNSKVYDILKWICMIALPAITTCATTIMYVTGVDQGTINIVVGIITAVNTLLGTLLGISSSEYYKNQINED